jgi:hypothetical protein
MKIRWGVLVCLLLSSATLKAQGLDQIPSEVLNLLNGCEYQHEKGETNDDEFVVQAGKGLKLYFVFCDLGQSVWYAAVLQGNGVFKRLNFPVFENSLKNADRAPNLRWGGRKSIRAFRSDGGGSGTEFNYEFDGKRFALSDQSDVDANQNRTSVYVWPGTNQ